jgi:hypothetical protein
MTVTRAHKVDLLPAPLAQTHKGSIAVPNLPRAREVRDYLVL